MSYNIDFKLSTCGKNDEVHCIFYDERVRFLINKDDLKVELKRDLQRLFNKRVDEARGNLIIPTIDGHKVLRLEDIIEDAHGNIVLILKVSPFYIRLN